MTRPPESPRPPAMMTIIHRIRRMIPMTPTGITAIMDITDSQNRIIAGP